MKTLTIYPASYQNTTPITVICDEYNITAYENGGCFIKTHCSLDELEAEVGFYFVGPTGHFIVRNYHPPLNLFGAK